MHKHNACSASEKQPAFISVSGSHQPFLREHPCEWERGSGDATVCPTALPAIKCSYCKWLRILIAQSGFLTPSLYLLHLHESLPLFNAPVWIPVSEQHTCLHPCLQSARPYNSQTPQQVYILHVQPPSPCHKSFRFHRSVSRERASIRSESVFNKSGNVWGTVLNKSACVWRRNSFY